MRDAELAERQQPGDLGVQARSVLEQAVLGHLQDQPVQVADLRASLDRSVLLGASVVAEPFDVPGGPTLAGITDPEGNPVMLVQA